MGLWGSVALIALFSFSAAALGVHVVVASLLSVVADCVCIIVALGGFGSSDASIAMALGFGLMCLLPSGALSITAVALGKLARDHLSKQGTRPLPAFGPPSIADSEDAAVKLALTQFRNGSAIKVKCPLCRRKLSCQRVLSSTNRTPDIEVVCPCGVCNGIHPFSASSRELQSAD